MGKGKRLKGRKAKEQRTFKDEFSSRFAANFRKELQKSEIWDQMVAEYGEERAEELLNDIKADINTGPLPDEGGDSSEDI